MWGESEIGCAAQAHIYANSAVARHREAAAAWQTAHPGARADEEACREGPPERRRALRRYVNHGTTLKVEDRAVTCRLIDLSPTGALVEAPGPLLPGSAVHLDVPDWGLLLASVVRATERRIGLKFATPLPA